MSKKKKTGKQSLHEKQHLMEVQYKKDYLQRLKHVCWAIGDESLFDIIPAKHKEFLLRYKLHNLKVRAEGENTLCPKYLKEIEKAAKSYLSDTKFEIIKGSGRTISFSDYGTIGISLCMLAKALNADDMKVEGMERFNEFIRVEEDLYKEYVEELQKCVNYIMLLMTTRDDKFVYTVNFELSSKSNPADLGTTIYMKSYPLPVKHFIHNNVSRPAVALTFSLNELVMLIEIPIEHLPGESIMKGFKIPVYIQMHAIDRLLQRTCLCTWGFARTFVSASIMMQHKILKDHKGDLLIEFYIYHAKAGYLVANVIDGMVVIRTFLFLTNNGTPEGKKLEEQTGLQKEDKKYLGIDNLRSLAFSDLLEDKKACDVFRKAGCGSLVELCARLKKNDDIAWEKIEDGTQTHISDIFLNYFSSFSPPGDGL